MATPAPTDHEAQQDQEVATAAAELSQTLDQNALITEGFRRIRENKWAGADGLDAVIVALQGGKPLDFAPSFP